MNETALNRKMHVSIFENLQAHDITVENLSLADIFKRIRDTKAVSKKGLPLLKLASFGDERTDKGSLRHDDNIIEVFGVEGDYDAGKMSIDEAADLLEEHGIAALLYETPSSTEESPRWRVLAPLSEPFRPDQRAWMLSRLNGALGGVLGSESFKLTQSYYFGSLAGQRTRREMVEGDHLDTLDDLDDIAMLPKSAKDERDREKQELIPLEEAHEKFDEDYEDGKLQSALDFALEAREDLGDDIDDRECRDEWWRDICWAIHHGCDGDKQGLKLWLDYAEKSWRADRLRARRESVKQAALREWRLAKDERPKGVLGLGTIYKRLTDHGWDWHGADHDLERDFEEMEDEWRHEMRAERQPDRSDGEVKAKNGVPAKLLTIHGILGAAVEHYNKTSTKTQPQFAVQAVFALASVVLGRNWRTDQDNYTSLYLVNLGETGSGKEFARTFIQKTLEEAGYDRLVGPTRYASEAGLLSEAMFKPRHVTIYDEFGRLLKSTGASSSTHQRDVQSMMMSAFGQLNGSIRPISYSTNNKTKDQIEAMRNAIVRRPAISLMGLSTPETFYDALSQDEVADGFLNRLLVVNTREKMKVERPRKWQPIPKVLKNWIEDHVMPGDPDFGDPDFGEEENATNPRGPIEVPFTDEATERLLEIEQEVIDRSMEFASRRLNGLWSRSKEIAQRIALIVALSERQKRVRTRHVDWAWDYVRFYTEEMCERAMTMLGAGPSVRIALDLAQTIEDAGRKGMAVRDMCKINYTFDRMSPRDREEVLERLRTSHGIVKVKPIKKHDPRGGRPPAERYVHEKFLDD